MTSRGDLYAYSEVAEKTAAMRWRKRKGFHETVEVARASGNYDLVNREDKLRKRQERVASKTGREAKYTQNNRELERLLNATRDLQFTAFLEKAIYVSQAVCRLVTRKCGGVHSYGTGFLVTRELLLTNHHVLSSKEDATSTQAEFGYQLDRNGNPNPRILRFDLDPLRFFVTDKKLDFTLVALQVDCDSRQLPSVWCPMIKELGKILILEHVNIIQHPLGREKQVVIRENRVIDSFEWKQPVLHYEADTERGSSGSPVFNDQWEVVAVHHASVPKTDSRGRWLKHGGQVWSKAKDEPDQIHWIANEGIRTSHIVQKIEDTKVVGPEAKRLQEEFLEARSPDYEILQELSQPNSRNAVGQNAGGIVHASDAMQSLVPDPLLRDTVSDAKSLSIPIRISVEIGAQLGQQVAIPGPMRDSKPILIKGNGQLPEGVTSRPSETMERGGYNPEFLGVGVPFPLLTVSTRPKAFAFPGKEGIAKYLIPYHHFSILFHRFRRFALVAGVNYDPLAPFQLSRDDGREDWKYDFRLEPVEELQVGEFLYEDNPLDKGHLVRRADAAWGRTEKEARLAADDTFHYTNCVPQHEIFNRGQANRAPEGLVLWRQIEDFLSTRGKEANRRLCIFNGPILREHDRVHHQVKLPREFWKIAVFLDDSGAPKSLAFRLTQASLIQGMEEAFTPHEYETVQVSIKSIESDTGLNFGKIAAWDTLEQEHAMESLAQGTSVVRLRELSQILM